jgi:F-box/WD-40 domain protein 5
MWSYLPYPVLYKIFQYLHYKDLVAVSEVCRSWYEVSRDDFLWKKVFFDNFLVDKSVPIISGKIYSTLDILLVN